MEPFYSKSPEDRQLKRAMKWGLVADEARVTQQLKSRCENFSFKLNSKCRAAVLAALGEFDAVCRFSLHIKTSMKEICLKVRDKAQILFVGGGVVEPLESLFTDFFEACGLNEIITALFKSKWTSKSNDLDFQFHSENAKEIVDEVVILLAEKMNWEWINGAQLTEELKKSQRRSEKVPYLKQVFAEHPKFERIKELAVKVFAFTKANDSAGHHYFRNLSSSETSYDCFFPERELPKINSFCLDITHIDDENSDIYLESLLGKEMLLQAIMDANFAILYTDPNHVANELDFARTICHLSRRGRLSGSGWLLKAYKALDENRKWGLSAVLAQQLNMRADDHHRTHQALIVLAFNASASLLMLDPTLEEEVQKLWEEIGNILIKGGKGEIEDPLLKQIKILMCESKCRFTDLLAQVQVSSMLVQHGGKGVYPTQSEGMLYTQIASVDNCTLCFPFALSEAITNLCPIEPIHDLLTAGHNLALGINKSVIRKYRDDPRRKFDETLKKAQELLKSKEEQKWKMGFLLVLSHMAMGEERALESLLRRKLPSKLADLLRQMLLDSGFYVRTTFYQNSSLNSVIGDLLSSDCAALIRLGNSLFKKVENDESHDVLEKLYLDLVQSGSEISFLKNLLEHMASSEQLSLESALKVYRLLMDRAGLEEILLDAVLTSLQRAKSCKGLNEFIQQILRSKTCLKYAHLGLLIAWEAHRLKIYSDAVPHLYSRAKSHPVCLTEKFDVRTDFMKHYGIQSTTALKASILRGEDIFPMLMPLAQSEDAWEERVFIMQESEKLIASDFQKILGQFSSTKKVEASFYLDLLEKAPLNYLLPALLELLRSDEDYIRCAKIILTYKSLVSEKFMSTILARGLLNEGLQICLAGLLEWTPLNLDHFVQAYDRCADEQKNQMLQHLKTIPKSLDLPKSFNLLVIRDLLNQCQDPKPGLFEVVHQAFVRIRPDVVLWSEYIQLALEKAPVQVLEKLLDELPGLDVCRRHFYSFFKRLEELDSPKFLQPETFWVPMWKKLADEPEDYKRKLTFRFIRGLSNCRVGDTQNGLKALESSPYVSPKDERFTTPLRIAFTKILWASGRAEHKSNALTLLNDTFVFMGDEPFSEKKAVNLFNAFLQTMPQDQSIDDINLTLIISQRIQWSASFSALNHVAILKYFKNVLKDSKNPKHEEWIKDTQGPLCRCIHDNVLALISRSQADAKVKPLDVLCVKWGIKTVYDSELLVGINMAVRCLEHPAIALYQDERDLQKLTHYKEVKEGLMSGTILKIMNTLDHFIECKDALTCPLKRRWYMKDQGLGNQFELQRGEKMAMDYAVKSTVVYYIKPALHIFCYVTMLAMAALRFLDKYYED